MSHDCFYVFFTFNGYNDGHEPLSKARARTHLALWLVVIGKICIFHKVGEHLNHPNGIDTDVRNWAVS
jgi:hypothetical protein